MDDIRIEQAKLDDVEEVTAAIGKLLDEIMQTMGINFFDFDAQQSAQLLSSFLQKGRYTVLLARDRNARLVGVVTLVEGCALYAGGVMGTILEFYVEPEWRSRGVGAALADAARTHAQSHGWRRLEVTTPPLPQFERTLRFYEHHGFAVTGGRKMKLEVSG